MAVDLKDGYKRIDKAAEVFPIYKKLKKDQKDLRKKVSDSFDKNENLVKTYLDDWKEKKQDYQKDVKSNFEELFNLFKLTRGAGANSDEYIKKVFQKSLKELKPKLKTILIDTIKKTLGCSTDINLITGQPFYIKVQSIDFFQFLTLSADTTVGKLIYEKNDPQYYQYPFSMNRLLYNRTQNLGQSLSSQYGDYKGKSGQPLFDIEYVQSYNTPLGQTITGDFYKVTFSQRQTPLNIDVFLDDYMESIDIFDQKNFFTQLINMITGAVFSYQDTSKTQITAFQKFMVIMKRILGLCYDSNPEIDVAGNSKVSERDLLSDDFFELSNLDLRLIEQKVSDISLGVIEFEECENVKFKMNTTAVIEALSSINFVEGVNETNELTKLSNVIYNVNDGRFKLGYDTSWILQFPQALIVSLLSPKILLPIMAISKNVVQGTTVDSTVTLDDFTKNFKTFLIELTSQIGAVFTKILFNIVRKDIQKLIAELLADVAKERKKKIKNMIFPLTILGVGVGFKILKDFRDCKSVVDDLTKLLSLVLNNKISNLQKLGPGADIPLPLLFASKLLDGYSPTRAYINVVKEFEELGIPTGPMPDGSPNEFLASVYSTIIGMDQEQAQNGKTVSAVPILTVTPLFTTLPKKSYGKST